MRTITIFEHISLDGVIQAPGGPEDDYAYGGWWWPFDDPILGDAMDVAHSTPFDLLLGRRTYDMWAGFWPTATSLPMAASYNGATKYVATHRPETLAWGPAQDLGQDIVAGIRRVKATDGPDLICWGSSTLASVLLVHGLANAVQLLVAPILLGTGKRFFSENAPPRVLALVTTVTAASGAMLNTYRPVGPVQTGAGADAMA